MLVMLCVDGLLHKPSKPHTAECIAAAGSLMSYSDKCQLLLYDLYAQNILH